jgi:hypothetical protein
MAMIRALLVGFSISIAASAAAIILGGGSDTPRKADCLIVLAGWEEDDLTPYGESGTPAVQCTDCDPACDHDGVPEANGICTFPVAACVNYPAPKPCEAVELQKIKSKAKSRISRLELTSALPLDGRSACGAFVDLHVPVRGKLTFRPGRGWVKLYAKRGEPRPRRDRDRIRFVCHPRPAGEACPAP